MGLAHRATMAVVVLACVLCSGCDRKSSGPDLSNPKAAALTFTRALESGDATTAKQAAMAGGLEVDLLDAMARSSAGLKRLQDVASAKFGEEGRRLTAATSMTVSQNLAEGDVDQDAERATVRSRDGHDYVRLQHVGDAWKVDVGALIRGQDISKVIPLFNAAGDAARAVADDITAGRCADAPAARRAMAEKIGTRFPQLLNQSGSPSTGSGGQTGVGWSAP